ncbi:Uncharacterized protein TCAP_03024 [Tolypocladium capitatum]|uniref:Fucose-specific lectin n=1 Tax=Tolypocladium capitatum TaxID=45235 RepID=A0A2K3QHK6_9HYPO|nr:Uncharacterized protein TCAP_03024 [Tolypocladium capitatum]
MVGAAAIVSKAVADDKSINLFFNTSKAQLGISLQSGTETDDQPNNIWATNDDDYNGYILNPSSIAGVYYRGVNFVAAVTMPKLDPNVTQTENQISLVSPVYQKLTTTTLDNNNVALCATPNGNDGWLYYLGGMAPSARVLKELSLRTGTSQGYQETNDVYPNGSLAAWYDPDLQQRHIIYEGGALLEFTVETKLRVNVPGTIARNTSLAAAYSSSTKKAYVYFHDTTQAVQRVIKDQYGWGIALPLPGVPKIAEASQMTVVQANGFNHLFYIAKDLGRSEIKSWSDFTHVRDRIF